MNHPVPALAVPALLAENDWEKQESSQEGKKLQEIDNLSPCKDKQEKNESDDLLSTNYII